MAVPLKLRLFTALRIEKPLYAIAVGDVDGDGKDDLVIGTEEGVIRIFKYERGAFGEIWSSPKHWQWIDQILIADLNQDYLNEVLVVIGRQLIVYKYEDPSYSRVWEYEAGGRITSVVIADSNNNKQKELLIGSNDGLLTIFTRKEEELFSFKQIWKRKLDGDVLVGVADVDADTLNEIIVASNNNIRVYRVIDKYPKKESWIHEFPNYIKKLLVFDLNSDNKSELFLGMENKILRIFSHKDGNYFSEDVNYTFQENVTAISSGQLQDRNLILVCSGDGILRGYRADSKLFQIELYEKCFSNALADIDNDGISEIICGGNNLYVFKEQKMLAVQMDYPKSLLVDEKFAINYYIKNNAQNRIYNLSFSNIEWDPDILILEGNKPNIPLLESNGTLEISLHFTPKEIQKVTTVDFPPFKLTFEMNNLQFSQTFSEMRINLLPKFTHIARSILARCETLVGSKVPLQSLTRLMRKELGSLDYEIENIVTRLLENNHIKGTLENRILYIRELGAPPEDELIVEPRTPEVKIFSPELLLSALKKTVERRKKNLLVDLAKQFNVEIPIIERALIKLKENYEITGFLVPTEGFYYLTLAEIDTIVTKVEATPYITLKELGEKYDLTEQELEFFLNDLINIGKIQGEIRKKDGITRFISIKTLSENIISSLRKKGKLVISTFSRKSNVSVPTIREAIRSLVDSSTIEGHYTFNGALFYSEEKLEQDILEYLMASETTSIGLNTLTSQFQIAKDVATLILNNIISKRLINGYISENTFFKKSYEEDKLRNLFEKYIDASNVIHILVIQRESGVTVFSESYTPETIDSGLVSGMLHAITSFGSELSGVELSGLRLLEYKTFKIIIRDGELIRSALILKSDPSQRLIDNLKHFVSFFNESYRENLERFKGSVDPFRSASSLVDDYFEVSLSFPHEVQEKMVFTNRDRLSANDLVAINIARGLGRQFLLGTLLEKYSKELLVSQLEAFSIIYHLKDRKIFQVITEARKWCPFCGSIIPQSAVTCPHCLRNIEDTIS